MTSAIRHSLPSELAENIRRIESERRRKFTLYGDVRDIIHVDFQGYKFVAVHSELHYSTNWKTFPDFLFDYIKTALNRAFGPEWAKQELARPVLERHPILRWYDALCRLQAEAKTKAGPGETAIYETALDGPSAAYLLLAYDLFTLAHAGMLHSPVVQRLRERLTFRSSRYELTVAATVLRAGFSIVHEDERDQRKRHPEFIATHKRLADVIAVEAKSKWRYGVIEWKRPAPPPKEFRLNIQDLMHSALRKKVTQPFVVFIDANMPPDIARYDQERWLREVALLLNEIAVKGFSEHGVFEGVPFTALVLTNFPHDYAAPGEPDPGKIVFVSEPEHPKYPFAHREIISDLERGLRQYGSVPNEFPVL